MSVRKEKRLRIAILLVITFIITLSIIAFIHTQRVKDTSSQIDHTKHVLLGLNDIYTIVVNHAGSARNYALYGKQEDKEKIHSSGNELKSRFIELRNQLNSDSTKQRLADSLERYIDKRIEHSNLIVIEGEANGLTAAEALYETGIGRDYNNKVHTIIGQIQSREIEYMQSTERKNMTAGNLVLSYYILALLGFIIILVVLILQKLRLDRAEEKKLAEQLRAFNETLEKQVQLKTKEKEHINYLLNERIKELTILHKVSQLLQLEHQSDKTLLQKVVSILPAGWQYVEHAAASITWDGETYYSVGFRESPHKQNASFQSFDGKVGTIEVVYLKEMPSEVEGPFMAEERNMLNTLGEMLQAYFNRKHAEERLTQSYQEIRQLASYIEKAREDEKIKIAREIHDDLGQQLTGLKMDVSWLGDKLNISGSPLHGKIEEMKLLLDEIVRSVRRIASELRPGILDDLGLVAAIKWQSREFQKRYGISTQFNSSSNEIELPSNLSTGIFRIFQESLTNVARHSKANQVTASLDLLDNELVLKISDDGVGFNVSTIGNKRTLGLLGMKERTALMGGKYEIISNEGTGTSVKISVPI